MSTVQEKPKTREDVAFLPIREAVIPGKAGFFSHDEGKFILFLGDATSLISALLLAHAATGWASLTAAEVLRLFIALGVAVFLCAAGNLYSLGRACSVLRTQRAVICAALVVFAALPLYVVPAEQALFGWSYTYAALAVGQVAVWRTAFAIWSQHLSFTRRLLILGAGVAGDLLADALVEKRRRGEVDYQVVGFADDEPSKQGELIHGAQVLGTSADIDHLVDKYTVDMIALAINRESVFSADVFSALVSAREKGIAVVSMPALFEEITGKIPVTHVGGNWGIMFPLEHQYNPMLRDIRVRMMDIAVGILGGLVLLAVCPFVMLANAISSKGPLFYSQLRVGKGGRNFRVYKFRSMVVNAEANGAKWCAENDNRITKVGNILRKTRLDELPQFWNILKGEMSLIGPRPERPEFVSYLSDSIPFYRVRHAIKPGLTGWAQVMYRYGASEEDSLIKLQYDLYYIKHRSLRLDLNIIAKTIKVVVGAMGR